MPIQRISTTPAPGSMIHVCAACGAEHTISFDRGAQKSRTGPFVLQPGDTLAIGLDGRAPVVVTFAAGDLPDFSRVTAAQLAAQLNAALPGVQARDDAGGLLIESATTGDESRVEICDGTARAALGFATDGPSDPCASRPVLGISLGPGSAQDRNIIALRRCNDCGANECLVRTFDATPRALHGTLVHEHRRAVNALAEHCRAAGWSHPELIAQHAAETSRPADVHPDLAAEPVDLSRFVRARGTPAPAGAEGRA